MVLLYVILSNMDVSHPINVSSEPGYTREQLLKTVGQSVEIFMAMDMVAVARRCVEVTQEVLDIAKRNPAGSTMAAGASSSALNSGGNTPLPAAGAMGPPAIGTTNPWDNISFAGFENDSLDFLIDSNLMQDFAPGFTSIGGGDGGLDFMDFNGVLGGGGSWMSS